MKGLCRGVLWWVLGLPRRALALSKRCFASAWPCTYHSVPYICRASSGMRAEGMSSPCTHPAQLRAPWLFDAIPFRCRFMETGMACQAPVGPPPLILHPPFACVQAAPCIVAYHSLTTSAAIAQHGLGPTRMATWCPQPPTWHHGAIKHQSCAAHVGRVGGAVHTAQQLQRACAPHRQSAPPRPHLPWQAREPPFLHQRACAEGVEAGHCRPVPMSPQLGKARARGGLRPLRCGHRTRLLRTAAPFGKGFAQAALLLLVPRRHLMA